VSTEEPAAGAADEKPSLFSISADDPIIQRIFKSLEDEVKVLSQQVRELQDDVAARPTREELGSIQPSMSEIDRNARAFSDVFDNLIISLCKFTTLSSEVSDTETPTCPSEPYRTVQYVEQKNQDACGAACVSATCVFVNILI